MVRCLIFQLKYFLLQTLTSCHALMLATQKSFTHF